LGGEKSQAQVLASVVQGEIRMIMHHWIALKKCTHARQVAMRKVSSLISLVFLVFLIF
jgi:hypothetical protein